MNLNFRERGKINNIDLHNPDFCSPSIILFPDPCFFPVLEAYQTRKERIFEKNHESVRQWCRKNRAFLRQAKGVVYAARLAPTRFAPLYWSSLRFKLPSISRVQQTPRVAELVIPALQQLFLRLLFLPGLRVPACLGLLLRPRTHARP